MVTVRVHPSPESGTERDENGDYIEVAGDPYDLEVIAVYPRESSEPGDPNRSLVTTGRTVLAPEGTKLSGHARIDIDLDGTLWEVDGEPRPWDARSNPLRSHGFRFTGLSFPSLGMGCVEINVKRANG